MGSLEYFFATVISDLDGESLIWKRSRGLIEGIHIICSVHKKRSKNFEWTHEISCERDSREIDASTVHSMNSFAPSKLSPRLLRVSRSKVWVVYFQTDFDWIIGPWNRSNSVRVLVHIQQHMCVIRCFHEFQICWRFHLTIGNCQRLPTLLSFLQNTKRGKEPFVRFRTSIIWKSTRRDPNMPWN